MENCTENVENNTGNGLRSDPDADAIFEIVFQGQMLKHLKAALRFGVFEVLEDNPEGVTADVFVKDHEFDDDIIRALLGALCCVNLIKREKNADGEWVYTNTPSIRKYLLKGRQPTLTSFVLQDDMITVQKRRPNEGMFHATKKPELPNGKNGMSQDDAKTDGKKPSWMKPEVMQMLMVSMDGCLAPSIPSLIGAFDLSSHKVAVDLGGGGGRFSMALSTQYPHLDVTLFDNPSICQFAPKMWGEKAQNIKFLAGDFFHDDLPEADLYVLGHILHDWTRPQQNILLTKVYKALSRGGRILLLEKMYDAETLQPEYIVSLSVILASNTMGKDSSAEEYTKLLQDHGFTDVQWKAIEGKNLYDAMIATKPL